ncbi:MAG: hypothetical protein ACJ71T_01405 [Actinomycetales bacterium]
MPTPPPPPASIEKPTAPPDTDQGEKGKKADYDKTAFDSGLDLYREAMKQLWSDDAATIAARRENTKTRRALAASSDEATRAAEVASLAGVQAAYITTTQSTLDRTLTRTNVLTASVGTIITLYTGLLAFIYTRAETATGGETGVTTQALQPVALLPVLFLALALFLATVYAAVLRNKTTVGPFLPTGIGGQVSEKRLVTYMNWCFEGVLARRWALHAGITSLGIGVATLPLPFTHTTNTQHWWIFGVGLSLVSLTAAWTQFGSWVVARYKQNAEARVPR